MSVVYGPWTAWYININNAFTTAQYDGMPSLLSSSPLFSSLLFCVLPIFCLFYIILFVLLVFFFHHLSKTCRIELLDARWIYRRTGTTIYSLPPPLSPFSLPLSPLSSLLSPPPLFFSFLLLNAQHLSVMATDHSWGTDFGVHWILPTAAVANQWTRV